MKRYWIASALPVFFTSAISVLQAAEPVADPGELPRIPAVEPAKAGETFQVKEGFRLELAASEPRVADPIAMSFDEYGRLYVVEMRGYSERRDDALGRIRLLEDTDGDGRFEKSTVFVDGLNWPTAVFACNGGIFVGATPDLWFFQDTNGDGVADERKVVWTGFGSSRDRLNVQSMFNSFRWGLDNRMHGATAGNGGVVKRPGDPDDKSVNLRGRDFSIDPRTLDLRAESHTAQHGMSFDNWGRKYVCSNSSHIQTLMYDPKYASRNSAYPMPSPRISVAADGAAAEVFRLSPDEPWRIVRTRWRITGAVRGVVEGGGRVSGYFTAATGVTIYRGDAFPEGFLGNAFIGDAGSNLIHRKRIRYNGVQPIASRPDDELEREFIASTDNWFRPVQFANAPDGCLYAADMYRETIEHPWSIPEAIKKHLDLNSGNDRGRIYRIVPEGHSRRSKVALGKAGLKQLVETLAHSNGWHRETAQRLLYQRQDAGAAPLVESLLERTESAPGRLHALYTLAGLKALEVSHLEPVLKDGNPHLREHALKLLEGLTPSGAPGDRGFPWQSIAALADDESPHVRYQLAFFYGGGDFPRKTEVLAKLARRDGGDKWIRAAIMNSVQKEAGELFGRLADDGNRAAAQEGPVMIELAGWIGRRGDDASVGQVIDAIVRLQDAKAQFDLTGSFVEGLAKSRRSWAKAPGGKKLSAVIERAKSELSEGPDPVRVAALNVLGLPGADAGGAVKEVLSGKPSEAVRMAAIRALGGYRSDASVPELILGQIESLSARNRVEAIQMLIGSPARAKVLLEAMQAGRVRAGDLTAAQLKALRSHRDREIKQLAQKTLGAPPSGNRQAVVDKFLVALRSEGDAGRGGEIYRKLCISCHKLGSEGHALGPDLVTMKSMGREKVMVNILDPNREVAPQFLSYEVETRDNESHSGLLADESDAGVILKQAFGIEQVVPRSNVASMRSTGRSLMPEGLEAGLTTQAMADLLEFIATANPK